MPRPVWTGIISFGLLNVPVSLYTAEKRVDLHFRMLDRRDHKPIRYERVNADTGEEVPWNKIVKAYEYEKGNYVVIDESDMNDIAPEGKETIDIESFVPAADLNPMYYEKPYYLVPAKKAEKGYVLLREALKRSERVGLGHVIIRTRRYLSIVMPVGDALVLNLLRFNQELVPLDEFDFPGEDLKALRITEKELTMAQQLMASMAEDWDPESYTDDYRERLHAMIERRLERKENLVRTREEAQPAPDTATNVVDFMALLKKSLDKGRAPAAGKTAAKAAPRQRRAKSSGGRTRASGRSEPAPKSGARKTPRSRK